MQVLPVVMAFDDNYLFPALVCVYSAKRSSSKDFSLMVAYEEKSLSAQSRGVIKAVCESLGVSVSMVEIEIPDNLVVHGHFSKSTWSRLLLPSAISTPFVYLDADLICTPGWDELLILPETAGFVADSAPLDIPVYGVRENVELLSAQNSARQASQGHYVNTGVLVIFPELLPKDFSVAVLRAASKYVELGFQWVDQCVMNFVLAGNVGFLPSGFNVLVKVGEQYFENGCIYHLAGSRKPWQGINRLFFPRSFGIRIWVKQAKNLVQFASINPRLQKLLRLEFSRLSRNDGIALSSLGLHKQILLRAIRFWFSRL